MNDVLPLLPTTMVGSYPRPLWFTQQLAGRDVLEAFKSRHTRRRFTTPCASVVSDQEDAGLDILTDGQMWFDDYRMGIGSFLWYWLERIDGFWREKLPHPARAHRARTPSRSTRPAASRSRARSSAARCAWRCSTTGRSVTAEADQGVRRRRARSSCRRWRTSRAARSRTATTCRARSPTCSAPRSRTSSRQAASTSSSRTSARGCRTCRATRTGTGSRRPSTARWRDSRASNALALLHGQRVGHKLEGMTAGGYREVLPHYHDVKVDAFVLDFACREMEDAGCSQAAERQERARRRDRRPHARDRASRAGRRARAQGAQGTSSPSA